MRGASSPSAGKPPTGGQGQPKVWAMLVFGGLVTVGAFWLLASRTDLTSVPRIVVSSLLGCLCGALAGRYKLVRTGALVLLTALVAISLASEAVAD
jgi:hypothetical protein